MRQLTTAALVLTTSVLTTSVLLGAPASAMVPPGVTGDPGPHRSARACEGAVLGVDNDGHVRDYTIVDGRVVKQRRASKKILFDVTAWGYFDSVKQGRDSTLRLNAVTADGQPRRISLELTRHGGIAYHGAFNYRQRSFSPALFADNYSYYAYTLDQGSLKRWTLTKFSDKHVKYVHPALVHRGMSDLTSLQATAITKVRGVPSEILYATTSSGRLLQVVVPFAHPGRARVHTLASSGYEGVTELSWTVCNPRGTGDQHALVAIDATGNRATWTTIEHAYRNPRATLRGPVTDAVPTPTEWRLSAAL